MRSSVNFPDPPSVLGCPCFGVLHPCICDTTERVLRAYSSKYYHLPSMTDAQRQWCLNEIRSVEGWDHYVVGQRTDDMLARDVLEAWNDYVRDKGLR